MPIFDYAAPASQIYLNSIIAMYIKFILQLLLADLCQVNITSAVIDSHTLMQLLVHRMLVVGWLPALPMLRRARKLLFSVH